MQEELMKSDRFYRENKIFYQKDLGRGTSFENHYLEIRKKENRLYSDHLAMDLPKIPINHPLKTEWLIRKNSADRLVHYLGRRKNCKSVMEVGCGNGWLTNRLARQLQVEICGVDINETELKQAARLFGDHPNVSFLYSDILAPPFDVRFDAIILASCIQYFPDLKSLIRQLLALTGKNGEIHILDSPIYNERKTALAAQERS